MSGPPLCSRPSLRGVRSHHTLGVSFGQWQRHMSLCSVPAGCPFSLGAASASCKHLPLPAYACIPLQSSGSASLCIPYTSGWSGQGVGPASSLLLILFPHWETTKSDEARLAGGCACSVCSEVICTVCPIYFLIMWPRLKCHSPGTGRFPSSAAVYL